MFQTERLSPSFDSFMLQANISAHLVTLSIAMTHPPSLGLTVAVHESHQMSGQQIWRRPEVPETHCNAAWDHWSPAGGWERPQTQEVAGTSACTFKRLAILCFFMLCVVVCFCVQYACVYNKNIEYTQTHTVYTKSYK